MWLDTYNNMTNAEKERFAKVTCYLLNKTFITREIYENKDKIGKINADYRFIERFYDLFNDYLNVINYKLEKNDAYGYIYLENTYGYNKANLDKITTLILFTLRGIFDEEKEKNSSGNIVYITTAALIYKMLELKIVDKKPAMKDMTSSLRLLVNQNILAKLEGDIEKSTCLFGILPTIMQVVSNEKIDAIYSMVFADEENEEKKPFEEDEDLENVMNL